MRTINEINATTIEQYRQAIHDARESRKRGFSEGKTWYATTLSSSSLEDLGTHILDFIGCYATEEEAVQGVLKHFGSNKILKTRKQLKTHIRNRNKYFMPESLFDTNVEFITIRQMTSANDYKCMYDYGKTLFRDINVLHERPEYIFPVYNERTYDPYATDEDTDAE